MQYNAWFSIFQVSSTQSTLDWQISQLLPLHLSIEHISLASKGPFSTTFPLKSAHNSVHLKLCTFSTEQTVPQHTQCLYTEPNYEGMITWYLLYNMAASTSLQSPRESNLGLMLQFNNIHSWCPAKFLLCSSVSFLEDLSVLFQRLEFTFVH